MENKDLQEMLNTTKACPECEGKGKKGEEACDVCNGSGVVIDNYITDEMIKNGIKGRAMIDFVKKIHKHYGQKLQDSYNRGFEDGRNEEKNK